MDLAEKHWAYIEGLLKSAGVEVTSLHRFLYVEAFRHGQRHEKLDNKGGVDDDSTD